MSGEHLDLSSELPAEPEAPGPGQVRGAGRPFLGIHFECCQVYARVYRRRDGQAYEGHCPRCSRRLTVPIGPGGTSTRFFTAG